MPRPLPLVALLLLLPAAALATGAVLSTLPQPIDPKGDYNISSTSEDRGVR